MLSGVKLNATKRRLLTLLHRLDRQRVDLSEEAFGPASNEGRGRDVPRRPDEEGGVRLEDEVTLGLLENEKHLTAQITVALARLDAGAYGSCEACYKPIPARRLRAVPYASRCIDCARVM
jgi:DnaK suppressor protein